MNSPFQPISGKAVGELAAIGSATAKALLQQMNQEAREAEQQKEALASAKKQETADERAKKIKDAQSAIDEGLADYEKYRRLAQDGLNKAFAASFQFPFDVNPKQQFDFLKKVHMPPSKPRPDEDLWAVFTTTEQFLHAVIAGHAHSSGR